MEELPEPNPDTLGLPDGMLIRPTVMAIFDSVKDEVTVTSPVYAEKGVGAKAAYARAQERVSEIVDALDRPLDHIALRGDAMRRRSRAATSNTSPDEYKAMVLKAKDYITAGDIFQVVLSQRFETEFTLPPFALYRSLRRVNPSPFLYYLDFDSLRGHRLEPGNSGARAGWQGDDQADCRNPAARRDTRRRPGAGRRTPRRSQGAGRASDAARSRAQRCGPRCRHRHDQSDGPVHPRILFSQVMHIVSNVEGKLGEESRRDRCAGGGLSGRHRFGCAESSRHGNHRRTGAREARRLCRLRRLFLGRWRDGYLHRAADRHRQGRQDVSCRREPASLPTACPKASIRNASTRRRPCSAPPKRRSALPAAPGGHNDHPHRQLRQLHLEPLPLSGRSRRRDGGSPQ